MEEPAKCFHVCHVACISTSPPHAGSEKRLWLYTEEIESNGQNFAFAFSTDSDYSRFAGIVTDESLSRMPLNVVDEPAIRDSRCDWFAVNAEDPNDETLWRVSADEFLKAKCARPTGKKGADVLCVQYRRKRQTLP
jgi:hypothetical protein